MDQDGKSLEKQVNGADNKGIDLSGALNDSGAGVNFEEYQVPRSLYPKTPKIIQWVIKYSGGFVKTEKQASFVLLGFVAAGVVIILFLILANISKPETFAPEAEAPPEEVFLPAEF